MTKLLTQSIRQTLLWAAVTGIIYPLIITAIAQLAFKDEANGSLVTRNGKDFAVLHEADRTHAGILVEYQDRDPTKNRKEADVVRAIGNLDASGWDLTGQFLALNAWSFAAPGDAPPPR